MASSTNKNANPSQDMNIDWKSLFSPCPVDIESQTPQQEKCPTNRLQIATGSSL